MSLPRVEECEFTLEPGAILAQDRQGHGRSEVDLTPSNPGLSNTAQNQRWDSATWTQEILKRQLVANSVTKLDTRLKDFLAEASADDQKAYAESRKRVLEIVKTVKQKHDARYPPAEPGSEKRLVDSIKSVWRSASETAYEYAQILDVMVGQAPEYVALAYGAIRIILVIQVNYEEMKQNVEEWMERIKSKFDLVDHLTTYFPSQRLVDAMTRMYDAFNRFLAKALKFYTRSRLRLALGSLKKPWKALEPVVNSIEVICTQIKDIIVFSTHFTGQVNLALGHANLSTNKLVLAKVDHLIDLIEGNSIKFSKPNDIEQAGGLFRQRVEAKLEQHQQNSSPTEPDHLPNPNPAPDTPRQGPSLDDHLSAVFVDLAEFDDAQSRQQRMAEQLPEMREHRKTQRNMLKADKVMDWLESRTSQLLWVDGNHILQRESFNASFVVPLLLFGEGTFETCLVLRHFCGDNASIRQSNYRTLIQALLRQLLKQRPDVWKTMAGEFTAANARDVRKLWALFVECLDKSQADCTFIVVDSIDFLASEVMDDGVDAREFVLRGLNELVKKPRPLVKILLTASLSQETHVTLSSSSSALASLSSAVTRQPRRSLSTRIMENNMALVPQKLLDIQEKRCTAVKFAELLMLYPVNSTVYTREDGVLRAFIISEISGMEERAFGVYAPLILRAWAVDHHQKHFVRRYYDLKIRQFAGEVDIERLQYIPAGYLPDEYLHRRKLIERGRRYWELSSKVHFMQCMVGESTYRVVVDQHLKPHRPADLQELDVRLAPIPASELAVLTALACPAQVGAYFLHDNTWRDVNIEDLEPPSFEEDPLCRLILPVQAKSVGKTTSARLCAEDIRRPLIEISAGEINTDEANAQKTFNRLLDQAKRWRAVILLENVDLLFREVTGNVSTTNHSAVLMVKALETHHGLVFLTTDSIGMLASDIRSRVTVPIFIPPLDRGTLSNLWARFLVDLNRRGSSIAESAFEALDRDIWKNMNGWDIKNAFATAPKLVPEDDGTLREEHLVTALKAQSDYKAYMENVFGHDDEERAMIMRRRAPDQGNNAKQKGGRAAQYDPGVKLDLPTTQLPTYLGTES
ncbi:hypothetical protein B0I37DRAFT_365964 [Chaetomium sp. MPI-CAGE-AT-0009]|nr:hypothetical protein B0I37DRAFT_365964 [Chaetomium sp. MPI-CAGE-AT-0009]